MAETTSGAESLKLLPLSSYVHDLRGELPASAFKRSTSRLAWLPVHLGIIVTSMIAIAAGWVSWPIQLVLSVVIGMCFAGLTFLAHEAIHGGIVKPRGVRHVIGWIGFLPWMMSPRLWTVWHDRVHHGAANDPNKDPDAYPRLAEYHSDKRVKFFIDFFAVGGRRWRGILSLVLGFTGQSTQILLTAVRREYLTPREHKLACLESALSVGVWVTLAALVGVVPFLLVFVVPLVICNMIVMTFILTNHSLSPLTAINDPLVNGLSVTGSRLFEFISLRFGYHVEHHLFPAMSSRHAPEVRALLRARWPERYQSMPILTALRELHRTGRVYKDDVTLIDPKTGIEYPTLQPGVRYVPT